MRKLLIAITALLLSSGIAEAQSAKPIILVVHGRGHLGHDSAQVRRDALHALEMSLHSAGADFTLDERDLRLVWYADLLDARAAGTSLSTCPASQISSADREKEAMPSALSLLALLAGPIFEAASSDAKGEDAVSLRGVAGELRYLADLDTRCAAEQRVADALRQARRERRPVILVSHSLGALVTWGELVHAAAARDTSIGTIDHWITLGSPLGSAEIRELIFGSQRSSLEKPAAVRHWVNVLGADDPFAIRIADSTADSLSDVATTKPHSDPHHILSYLYDTETAKVIMDAWHSTIRPR